MVTSDVVEIDPDGDVFLFCGGEATSNEVCKLRVSSSVLRFGSPVFKSLLGPSFKEGNTLAQCATVEVPLPEDNPKDMQRLCQILHFLHDEVLVTPGPEEVMRFAILCDKYGCANAVRPWIELWVRDGMQSASNQEMATYMEVALLLQYHELVHRVGAALIRDASTSIAETVKPQGSKLKLICGMWLNLVRMWTSHAVTDPTAAELDIIREKFVRGLSHLIEDELDNVLLCRESSECEEECMVYTIRVATFGRELRNTALWPGFNRSGALDADLRSAETFEAQDLPNAVACGAAVRCQKNMRSLEEYSNSVNARAKTPRKALEDIDLRHLEG
ncbi:hypothetical protein LTR27_004449 [Elasticomyces elasticus]|nr:hypothetical protein LTR27_004449 [Elasticomyces elasticus]